MGRLVEFFEDDTQTLSMSRLLTFMAFFPATYILIVTKSENVMLYYVGAFVLNYIGGKVGDVMGRPHMRPSDQNVTINSDKVSVSPQP